ncbi:hypothetical protein VCR17J2_430008 [Vibrio coralliirubri]|nr:hypothetical protein VCR17J2_430008 [Vibrio coralliirubri]
MDIETALIERRFYIYYQLLTATSITTEIECDDTCDQRIASWCHWPFSSPVTAGTGTVHNDL